MNSPLHNLIGQLRRGTPGRRFVDYYCRHDPDKALWKKWLLGLLGGLMMIGGLLLSLPPGVPGFLLWIPGAGLIAAQFRAAAVALDRLECGARYLYRKVFRRPV